MAQISIIQKSDITKAGRFDAEYFKPEYLKVINTIKQQKFLLNSEVSLIKSGRTPIDRDENLKSGVVLLKTGNIRDNILFNNTKNYFYISNEINKRMTRTELRKSDVLLNIVGATTDVIGRTALVPNDFPKSNITQAMAFCRVINESIKPEYLFIFFQTKFGKNQTERLARPTGQFNLNLQEVGSFLIPILPELFQRQIEKIVKEAHIKQKQSKELYAQAEELLLKELGLVDYQPQHKLTFSALKREVEQAERFDSEYFQPKYNDIISKIENYSGGVDTVKNQFNQNRTLSKKDKGFYNYIEIGSINISNGEIIPSLLDVADIPANGKRTLFKNDLLVSKVRPYRGAVSFIDFEQDNLLGSGAFTVLQEKTNYKKEVLMIFLKAQFIKELLLRYNCGTSYPVIKDEDVLNLKIPLIKQSIQKQIATNITQSHKLRKESKELLELAKSKVEQEIEKTANNL